MQSICLKDNIKFLIEFQTLVVEDFFLKQGVIIIKVYVFSFIDLIMIYNFNNPVIIIILYTCFLWLFCFCLGQSYFPWSLYSPGQDRLAISQISFLRIRSSLCNHESQLVGEQ